MPCRTSRKKKRRRSENERKKFFFLFLFLSLIILPALVEFRRRSLQNMKWKKNRKIEKPCWFNICSLFNQKKNFVFYYFSFEITLLLFLTHFGESKRELSLSVSSSYRNRESFPDNFIRRDCCQVPTHPLRVVFSSATIIALISWLSLFCRVT